MASPHTGLIDPNTGKLRQPQPGRLIEQHLYPILNPGQYAQTKELHTVGLSHTDSFKKRPPVRTDARELYEDLILEEFPDDPIPIPSEHLMELMFEYASLKAKDAPKTHYTLHSSALLTASMAVNDYMVHLMRPIVQAHVKRCLDEEEAAESNRLQSLSSDEEDSFSADEGIPTESETANVAHSQPEEDIEDIDADR